MSAARSGALARVLVTGATGVIGRRVVPQLVARGHRVTAVARTPEKRALIAGWGADAIDLDLTDAGDARRAMAGHDVVVNLATHIPPSTLRMLLPWAWRENDRLRRDGSANLVDAALAVGVSRFIQESFILRTERLTRVVEGHAIVDGISIEVPQGDVLAIVGPSGSGKSSFLRLLDRLDEPTDGTVYLDGRDYRTIPPRELRRRVGMVLQTAFLFLGTVASKHVLDHGCLDGQRDPSGRAVRPARPRATHPAQRRRR